MKLFKKAVPSKLWAIRPLFLGALTGLVLSPALFFCLSPKILAQSDSGPAVKAPAVQPKAASATPQPADVGLPVRLEIPAIKLNVALERVGLTPQGALDVAKGPLNASWFDLGPRPGQVGSAVVDGHFGWIDGMPAVFDNLHKLKPGDQISVIDETGVTTTFVVRKLQLYAQNADTSAIFSSNDGKAHLNLITCEGIWSKVTKSFSNRLVVFADKVGQ